MLTRLRASLSPPHALPRGGAWGKRNQTRAPSAASAGTSGRSGPGVSGRSLLSSEPWASCRTSKVVLSFPRDECPLMHLSKETSCLFPEPESKSKPPECRSLHFFRRNSFGPFQKSENHTSGKCKRFEVRGVVSLALLTARKYSILNLTVETKDFFLSSILGGVGNWSFWPGRAGCKQRTSLLSWKGS